MRDTDKIKNMTLGELKQALKYFIQDEAEGAAKLCLWRERFAKIREGSKVIYDGIEYKVVAAEQYLGMYQYKSLTLEVCKQQKKITIDFDEPKPNLELVE